MTLLHLRAARVWAHRQRIEHEAATLFTQLAEELDVTGYTALARRAAAAADDERRHAGRCRALVIALGGTPANDEPARVIELGPRHLTRRDRMLYAAVAVGCVTESLSCSLLLALREAAVHEQVRATVDEVLADEIEHSRIGWSVLAAESARRDVSWLRAHLPAMAAAAFDEDVKPMIGDDELAGLGVLPRGQVSSLVSETWTTVIGRGLERHGIAVASAA